ncbi:MAG: pilus assembly PilX family protein [Sulfuricaulis sp.]
MQYLARQSISNHERGIVLVMALVMLVLLTLTALTAITASSLEEKMTYNTQDRNVAFQAAETTLVAAENWLHSQGNSVTASEPGVYNPATPSNPLYANGNWISSTIPVSYPCTPTLSTGCGNSLNDVNTQPTYIIEIMGPIDAVPHIEYRITARGTGSRDTSVVMLQSTYIQ